MYFEVYYPVTRAMLEIISAVACFILLRFMIKPFTVTGEGRYIGLPLGFGFLGASYVVSAVAYLQPDFNDSEIKIVQLLFRAFAFVFLAVAYYFSKKPTKNTRLIWDVTFSVLLVGLVALLMLNFIAPQIPLRTYETLNTAVRILNIACLAYIIIHCYRERKTEKDSLSTWIIAGYAFLTLNQAACIVWAVCTDYTAFWVSIVFRLIGLGIFLFATYRTFYRLRKRHYT
jgi:hypothetical protein